jgi:hypothetical protein
VQLPNNKNTDNYVISNPTTKPHINRNSQKRGAVYSFSKISKKRLKKSILEFPNLTHTIIVTYGQYAPITSNESRSECLRLRKLLTKFHISGIWKIEFQERAALHVHLAVSMHLSMVNRISEIEKHFFKYSNSFTRGSFNVQTISDIDGLIRYFTKPPGLVPANWHGRFWAEFGKKYSYLPEPIEADEQEEKRKQILISQPKTPPDEDEKGREEEEEISLTC